MAICQFFLQGRCRFGEKCWNEHPRGGDRGRAGPSASQHQGGGGWGATNQRYTNVIQPSTFKTHSWGGSRDQGRGFFGSSDSGSSGDSSTNADFSRNRFSALLNSQSAADGYKDEEERLLECVAKDMEIWESSGQWIFSSYSPMKGKPNISGFPDFSPEELHLEYYSCRANHNVQSYINSVQQLAVQWKTRLIQLKALDSSTRAALLSELKNTVTQPVPAFGFGGQVTPSFGSSSFSASSSNSASTFSFKTSTSLGSGSSGNSSAFGSSSAGLTASPSITHSVGFGNPTAPSAASFSFKPLEATSGFGTSGFGSSAAVNPSGTTPPTAFGSLNTAVAASPSHPSSSLFGQAASASGQNTTPAFSAGTDTASEKLFTPKSELSTEELKQFEARKFTLGKIPLKPPPLECLSV
ncbi:NUPL2 protein, partial [Semnornis frantzii]|nr:NUPL2 protein [Semnornis frantzii]